MTQSSPPQPCINMSCKNCDCSCPVCEGLTDDLQAISLSFDPDLIDEYMADNFPDADCCSFGSVLGTDFWIAPVAPADPCGFGLHIPLDTYVPGCDCSLYIVCRIIDTRIITVNLYWFNGTAFDPNPANWNTIIDCVLKWTTAINDTTCCVEAIASGDLYTCSPMITIAAMDGIFFT